MANNLAGANSETSAIGANSVVTVGGAGWSAGNTVFETAGEQANFEYVYSSLFAVGASGTLFYSFSNDGTNYDSTYPTDGYDVADGIHKYRSAHLGQRYVKLRIEFDAAPSAIRLYTRYTNTQVQTNSTLRQALSVDADSVTVKAVGAGEIQNADGTGSGTVLVAQLTPEKAQIVDMPNVTIYQNSSEISGSLPSGPLPTYTPAAPIVAANVIDTFWMDKRLLNVASSRFYANIPGVFVFIADASDALGNNSNTTGFTFPTLTSVAGIGRNVKARVFQDFVRIIIINTTGSTMSQWAFRMKGNNSESGDISISGDELILTSFPMALGQNLIRGESDDGTTITYPAQVHRNTSTGAVSLAVVQGARISEAFDKEHVQAAAIGTTTSQTIHTVTAGKRLWVTSFVVTMSNVLSASGTLVLRDGSSAIDTGVIGFEIEPGTNQTKASTKLSGNFEEPVLFEDGVFVDFPPLGTLGQASVFVVGYEEPI